MAENNEKWLPGFEPPKQKPTHTSNEGGFVTVEEFQRKMDNMLADINKHKEYLKTLPPSLRGYVDPIETRIVVVPSDKEMDKERSNLREEWLKTKKYTWMECGLEAVIFELSSGELCITTPYQDSEDELKLKTHLLNPNCKNKILEIIGVK